MINRVRDLDHDIATVLKLLPEAAKREPRVSYLRPIQEFQRKIHFVELCRRREPEYCLTAGISFTHRYPRRARKARVVQRSDAGRKSKARPDQTINGTFWDYNPKKAEHSGNIIPIFAKLKTCRRDGQGFGGASNAFAKLAGSAGSWSILSGETTVTGMFG